MAEINCKRKEHSYPIFINGEQIEQHLPGVSRLYLEIGGLASEISGEERLPLSNKKAAVNGNIMLAGGEYRWHYDQNTITALLYPNKGDGGEIEFYPNYGS